MGNALLLRQEAHKLGYGNVGEFLRFKFVESSAIDPPLTQEPFGRNLVENLPDVADEVRITFEPAGQEGGRIHREINIGDRSVRAVQDEAEGPACLGVAAAEIGADDRRRRTVL